MRAEGGGREPDCGRQLGPGREGERGRKGGGGGGEIATSNCRP